MNGDIKPRYTVLSYIINDYEVVHEVEKKSENAEYILVTENPSITSSTWNVVYVDNPNPEDPFGICYDIRFHPFRYAHTDVVLRIDGSMIIHESLDPIIDKFNEGNYDMALCVHPTRQTMVEEYSAWVAVRGYPMEQAKKVLHFMRDVEGYPIETFKGMYQYNFMIQRNTVGVNLSNDMTYDLLRYLAPDGKVTDRVDQTVGSFLLNKYFNGFKIMPVDDGLFESRFFSWCSHGTSNPMRMVDKSERVEPHLFGQPVTTIAFE